MISQQIPTYVQPLSVKNNAPPTPGSFPGILARIEELTKKAYSISAHAGNLRSRIGGSFPEEGKSGGPAVVPNGILDEFESALNELGSVLDRTDAALEFVSGKF